MKKSLIVLFISALLLLASGCGRAGNMEIAALTYTFDYAIISLPNGEAIEGEVESWKYYSGGDCLQLKIDGRVYLVHSVNVALIKAPQADN